MTQDLPSVTEVQKTMDRPAASRSSLDGGVLSPSSSSAAVSPSFIGNVETTLDALRLVRAAQQGVIPRIARPLKKSERETMVKSGAVFIFCVQESGIRRWNGTYYALMYLLISWKMIVFLSFKTD